MFLTGLVLVGEVRQQELQVAVQALLADRVVQQELQQDLRQAKPPVCMWAITARLGSIRDAQYAALYDAVEPRANPAVVFHTE